MVRNDSACRCILYYLLDDDWQAECDLCHAWVWTRANWSLTPLPPLCTLDTKFPPPVSSPPSLPLLLLSLSSPLLSAELDAHRHNRWYSTTERRSARIQCTTTFISLNFTGPFSPIGGGGALDFDSDWILRLEAEFGVKVSCGVFIFFSLLNSRSHLGSELTERTCCLRKISKCDDFQYFLPLSTHFSLLWTQTTTV